MQVWSFAEFIASDLEDSDQVVLLLLAVKEDVLWTRVHFTSACCDNVLESIFQVQEIHGSSVYHGVWR